MSAADVLKSYVPDFVTKSKTFQTVYGIQGGEIDKLKADVSDIVNQCFIETATWGLKYWETFLGIVVDESKDVNYRRGIIKSRIRGMGTITVAVIKSIAESYGSETEVIEYPAEYRFLIRFKGTPPNFVDLTNTIEEIKPAHLAWNIIYIMQGSMTIASANISGESGRVLPDVANGLKSQGNLTAGMAELSGESARILPDISDGLNSQGLLIAGSAETSGESTVIYPFVESSSKIESQLFMACFLSIGEHTIIKY